MAGFMDQPDKIRGVPLDSVVNVVGKRAAVLAGETVGPNMITASQSNDCSYRIHDSRVEVVS
jgi:hypothetical protein